tara:strand:- start:12007 stop:14013 length:2007 start_codon:yes stop_codon:yes gene_type:complete
MAWAALGKKLATGMVKGKAKKIAADKLLNRKKKKTVAKRPTLDELIADVRGSGTDQTKGGALAVRPTTSLVPTAPSKAITSGGSVGVEDTLTRIKIKVISIDQVLKGTLAAEKARKKDAETAQEQAEQAAAEKKLETKPKKKKKKMGMKAPKQVLSLWERLKKFFTTIVFGYVALKLLPLLPKLIPIAEGLFKAVDGILWIVGKGFDIVATVVDWGYKLYDLAMGFIGNVVGEEGMKHIESLMEGLNSLVNGFLMWKIFGKKIFDSVLASVKRAFRIARVVVKKAFKFAKNLAGKGLNLVKNVGGKILNVGKSVLGKTASIAGKGANIISKGAGVAKEVVKKGAAKVGGWAVKIFGKAAKVVAPAMKAAMPAVKGFAKRIPILGPLIVGIVSMMTGDPPGQAMFKALGAAVGGALGTFIPVPVLGTLIGETIGVYGGDLMYSMLFGGGAKAVGEKIKGDFKQVLDGGKQILDWIKTGFSRFMEGLPKNPFKLGGFILNPFNIGDKVNLLRRALFSREPMNPEKDKKDDKDTLKGEVDGKEPPKPKTDRGGKVQTTSSKSFNSLGESTYKINDQVVSSKEYGEYQDLSRKERMNYVTKAKADANNILATNNNIRDGINKSASYEEGADTVVIVQQKTETPLPQTRRDELVLSGGGGSTEDPYETLDANG